MGYPEQVVAAVEDAFSANPEIGGFYGHWGDASAFVSGLKAVDRYYPVGDPRHVAVICQDVDIVAIEQLRDGYFDAVGSGEPYHLIDPLIKVALHQVILGQDVADEIWVPLTLITKENVDTVRMFGATVVFTDMPKTAPIPVLDTTEIGISTPTVEMRKELMGY